MKQNEGSCEAQVIFRESDRHLCRRYSFRWTCRQGEIETMLLNNKILDQIIAGEISVVFRVWKRPTVKKGGTLKTRKGVLLIKNIEEIDRSEVTDKDLQKAGLKSLDELSGYEREGNFYRITVSFAGEDPRIAMRKNLDISELTKICERLQTIGDWPREYLQMIGNRPNIHAQILADSVGLPKLSFKQRVRKLKGFGLTESLRPGYKLSPRGEKVLELMNTRRK